ncbi:MAG: hypothetical protein HY922_09130 [Elusimicrobia bacterium]|nr:hypothetical protein [Elusimicrobiota bacterium]
MDILIKLRVYLWLMVLSLWGLMIFQFLEDEGGGLQPMRWLSSKPSPQAEEKAPAAPTVSIAELFPKPVEDLRPEPLPSSSGLVQNGAGTASKAFALTSLPRPAREPAQPSGLLLVSRLQVQPAPPAARPPSRPPAVEPAAPKGFSKVQTRHFIVFSEGEEMSKDFVQTIENLHANLMLDLAAFSPWARDERVTIHVFRSQESYRKVTGRPSWSGGASSVKSRKIYLYESDESIGILAHELCHIYFDSFFLGGKTNPLWLSEGMSTLVQTERGLAAPSWLKENMALLRQGGGYSLSEMLTVENTTGADDSSVRLWYTQAFSVVRFLIRAQYRSSFYRFCTHLKNGFPIHEALYRAYGMPFNRVKALEYAWRHDLKSDKL